MWSVGHNIITAALTSNIWFLSVAMGKQNEEKVHNFSPFVVSTASTKIMGWRRQIAKGSFYCGRGWSESLEEWALLRSTPPQTCSDQFKCELQENYSKLVFSQTLISTLLAPTLKLFGYFCLDQTTILKKKIIIWTQDETVLTITSLSLWFSF